MSGFDALTHHRDRTRRAEQRADMLERERARLERLLALALKTAAGQDCEPLELLAVLEELDEATQPRRRALRDLSIDDALQLLRATDPDRLGGRRHLRVVSNHESAA